MQLWKSESCYRRLSAEGWCGLSWESKWPSGKYPSGLHGRYPSSVLASFDDAFAEKTGSVHLQESWTLILCEVIIWAVQHDRWSPDREMILCMHIVLNESWNTPVIGWFKDKLSEGKILIPFLRKDWKYVFPTLVPLLNFSTISICLRYLDCSFRSAPKYASCLIAFATRSSMSNGESFEPMLSGMNWSPSPGE